MASALGLMPSMLDKRDQGNQFHAGKSSSKRPKIKVQPPAAWYFSIYYITLHYITYIYIIYIYLQYILPLEKINGM